jgi:hypothetical protein
MFTRAQGIARLAVCLGVAALLATCQSSFIPEKLRTVPFSYDAKTLDVCEALFRHQFDHNGSGIQQRARAYYLIIEEGDPDPAFLARFSDLGKPVLPGSQFLKGDGLSFRIDSIKWVDDHTVEMTGGYYEGNLSSSGNTYRLELRDGKWTVTMDAMRWIS